MRWLGPGFLWMVSAAGSGELLFTPRIGAQYGYALLWALLAAVALKWFINREIGRYAVTTGAPVLEGFATLPGPRMGMSFTTSRTLGSAFSSSCSDG